MSGRVTSGFRAASLAPRLKLAAWHPQLRPIRQSPEQPAWGRRPSMGYCSTVWLSSLPQGYEDWLRHKADNAMNQCPVHFIQHGKLVRKQSRKLRVSNPGTVLQPKPKPKKQQREQGFI